MKLIIKYKKPIYDNNKIIKFDIVNTYIIDKKSTKHGKGDIFDNLTIDDIIVEKEPKFKKEKEDTKTTVKSKELNKINLNKNITIFNLKELIYYVTDIAIENQHIEYYNKLNNNYETLDYIYQHMTLDILINASFNNINLDNLEYIENLFIDFNLVNNRNLYLLKSYDIIKRLYNLLLLKDELEIEIFNLDDFIQNKNIYKNKISQDNELNEIIYYGFIEKYFPMYNLEIFNLYINDKNIYDIYPQLKIKNNKLILDKLDKYEILNKVKNIDNKKIKEYIKEIQFKVNSFNKNNSLNLYDIFNNFEIIKYDNINKIEMQLFLNDKNIYYSKTNILYDLPENNLYLRKLNYNKNVILFSYNLSNEKYNLNNEKLYIIIDEYKNLNINLVIEELSELSIKDYYNLIHKEINLFINKINKNLNLSITTINEYNITIDNLSIHFLFDTIFNNESFNKLIKKIQEYEIMDIYKINNIDNNLNIIEIEQLNIDFSKIENIDELTKYTNNYYDYLLNYELNEKYYKILNLPKINIYNRIKDIKIEFIKLNEYEIKNIKDIILKIISEIKITDKKTIIESSTKLNKLKKLKELDPVLYIINKKNTQNLYSRKCQSAQQPEIITKTEIEKDKIKNYIKYWNFTNGTDEYYHCPNKKYQYVKFLTNLHPQNYCIPCCKKKSMDDIKIKSKYESIHKICLANYEYDKKNLNLDFDNKSRYIINYSNKILIENERLMSLPSILYNLIKKTFQIESLKKENKDKIYNYYIYGINQNLPNLNNIGMLYILSNLLDKTIFETIKLINDTLINNPEIFSIILDGKLVKYYNNINNFLVIFNNIFHNKIELKNLNYEFNKWNEFIIEISKYFGIIYIQFEEKEEDNVNLVLPKNINNINEYIYNNDNYKYSIIFKRNIKNKFIYYPVFYLNYKDYYNLNIFKNKIYESSNNLIQIIKQIYVKNIDNNISNLNIDIIFEFLFDNKLYEIEKYFINIQNEIYSLLIKEIKTKSYIYINVNSQKIKNSTFKDTLNNKLYEYKPFNINSNYKLSFNNVYNFITNLNIFIYNKNKIYYSDLYYKLIGNELLVNNINKNNNLILSEKKNLENTAFDLNKIKLIDYIYIDNFIIYKDSIIGIRSNNLNIYINDQISIENSITNLQNELNKIKRIINNKNIKKDDIKYIITRFFKLENNNIKNNKLLKLDKIYNKIKNYSNYYIIYKYHPLEINKVLKENKDYRDDRIINLNKSLYNTNLYNLILYDTIDKLTKLYNKNIRSKIKYLITNFNKNNISEILINKRNIDIKDIVENIKFDKNIYSIYDIIQYKLKIYDDILLFLKDILINNKERDIKQLKKIILEKFDNTRFTFDKFYINEILHLQKNEIIKELKNILKKTIIHKKLNEDENIEQIIQCNNTKKSFYCDNYKLIITKENYNILLDIIYYDITNIYKQKILFNLVNYNINNIYKFKYYLNEKIYIFL